MSFEDIFQNNGEQAPEQEPSPEVLKALSEVYADLDGSFEKIMAKLNEARTKAAGPEDQVMIDDAQKTVERFRAELQEGKQG